MGLSIASSIASLNAQTQLGKINSRLSDTFERLASGQRINKASDDPAGIAVADGLRADVAVATVALQNANDGISITSTADSALDEISSILTRMYELAEQSSNGVYTATTRSTLSAEFEALGSEVQRIAVTTEFNDTSLLSASSDISIQVGFDSSANSRIVISGVLATLDELGLATTGSSALSYSINATTDDAGKSAAALALTALDSAIDTLSTKRGLVGAAESRLNYAVSYITVARENFAAAESRIRDADVAQEVAELVKLQVLQQSATAILAQANQQPGVALALLQ